MKNLTSPKPKSSIGGVTIEEQNSEDESGTDSDEKVEEFKEEEIEDEDDIFKKVSF